MFIDMKKNSLKSKNILLTLNKESDKHKINL